MFGSGYNQSKLNSSLGQSVLRMRQLKQKNTNELKAVKREIEGLLRAKTFERARIRAENFMRLERTTEAIDRLVSAAQCGCAACRPPSPRRAHAAPRRMRRPSRGSTSMEEWQLSSLNTRPSLHSPVQENMSEQLKERVGFISQQKECPEDLSRA